MAVCRSSTKNGKLGRQFTKNKRYAPYLIISASYVHYTVHLYIQVLQMNIVINKRKWGFGDEWEKKIFNM